MHTSKVILKKCITQPFHKTSCHRWREKYPVYIPLYLQLTEETQWQTEIYGYFRPNNIYWAEAKETCHINVSEDARILIQCTRLLFYISLSCFFVFLQIDKINIYDRQTTMRNEIHLSKVFVTWDFVAKARARETIAHKLVNTRVECSPFVQFISWELIQASTLLLICFSSRNCQLTFGQYCNTIQSSKL